MSYRPRERELEFVVWLLANAREEHEFETAQVNARDVVDRLGNQFGGWRRKKLVAMFKVVDE